LLALVMESNPPGNGFGAAIGEGAAVGNHRHAHALAFRGLNKGKSSAMILLAAILSATAIAAPPPRAPQVRSAQTRKVRAKPHAKKRVARARLPVLRAITLTEPKPDPSARYRISGGTSVEDAKLRAASDSGMACGVTGAPVCPSKPRTIVSAAITND
jgi:hypothetical protein